MAFAVTASESVSPKLANQAAPSPWQRIRSYRPGRLARNTVAMMLGLGLRTLLQGGLFILLARNLGAKGYGEWVAVLSIISVFSPFVGMGSAILLVQEAARNPERFPNVYGRGLFWIAATGLPLLALAMLAGLWFLQGGAAWPIFLLIGLAEFICAPLVDIAACAFQAFERMRHTAFIMNGLMALRLLGMVALIFLSGAITTETWAACYLGMSAIAAISALSLVQAVYGRPRIRIGNFRELREGFYFALSSASWRVNADIDKALLARLDGVASAGSYSAAYRVADMATLPIQALLSASLSRFFRAGETGSADASQYALRLLPIPILYVTLAGGLLWWGAGIIPWLLGSSFKESVAIVQWLALLPALSLPHFILATIAGASGHQQSNALVHGVGALGNVAINWLLIPIWGWRGAVVTTFVMEVVISLALALVIARQHHRQIKNNI